MSDTGKGITEENLPKVFDQFFHESSVDKGVGLGLATAQTIAKAHNGTIQVVEHMILYSMDIVILDINMPGIGGHYIYDIIKEYNPNQKIIVASVYPIHQQRSIIPFADDYFDKSQGPVKFLEKVSGSLSIN